MSTKWKKVTGGFYVILCPQSGKVELENSEIFYVRKVEKFNRTMFHVHEVEKFSLRTLLYFTSTKWKSLTGELYDTS